MTEESIRLSCRTKNFIDTFGLTSCTPYYLKGSTFFIDSGPELQFFMPCHWPLKWHVKLVLSIGMPLSYNLNAQ
jgi:hypothetical protein